jgi:uncharacterized protein YyaL (SSP411 family)
MRNNPNYTNHLIGEKSPYLLAHAQNPVDWHPWGKAAFDRAKLEDKPVLLSVGYSTCHWCHVMAHESFEDEGISRIINEHFIAIKVDREERPDIDHIYMTATTAMTGQGGWPLTVFLTPQGDPFYGGTYFPPYAKWGNVGFADLLGSIAKAWAADRANILTSSRSITEGLLQRQQKEASSAEKMDEAVLNNALRQMRGQFDPENKGFGSAPKFPMGHNLSFLLRCYKRSSSMEALNMAGETLTAMARGGIWDHLAGGFHRYSTDQSWHVPHFEKMLYDQALLSRVYLEAYQVFHSEEYAHIAREILDYVQRDMTDPLGAFYSAEDADSLEGVDGHLKEGAFYVFSQSEIESVLGKEQAAVFNYCYGVLPHGNAAVDPHGEFKGKNILYRAHNIDEAAAKFLKKEDEIKEALKDGRAKLSALRSQRPRPYKDNKVLCDWNGLMIASFAFASRVLGESRYAQTAVKAADFILGSMRAAPAGGAASGRLLHRWRDGEAGITGTLEDYAFFIYGLLEVYEATFHDKYLDAAQGLADRMIEYFADQVGGFYMTASDAESLIIRPKEAYDGALPSGNSAAALILLKLYALTKKDVYNRQAQALFSCFASSVAQAPYAHCFLLSALDLHLQGPLEITFQGALDDPMVAKMLKVLYKHFIPSKAVKYVLALGKGQANICERGTCKAPIDSVSAFEQEILSGTDL